MDAAGSPVPEAGMSLLTRRNLLAAGATLLATGASGSAYAMVIEPGFRLIVQEYRIPMASWGDRPELLICATADLHSGDPWMPLSRVERIVDLANRLQPDLHVVLGDLPGALRGRFRRAFPAPPPEETAWRLGRLEAPLGVFAVTGNHDWWDDRESVLNRQGPPRSARAMSEAGLRLLSNEATRLPLGPPGRDGGVWLSGIDSQQAFWPLMHWEGADDLPAALAPLALDDAPAILLAHEPDIFPHVPARVGLTLSGHTHGGQIRILGYSPIVPSRYGRRYAYGLVEEEGRRLVVSGGLGCSRYPVRFGVPPELTLVRLGPPGKA